MALEICIEQLLIQMSSETEIIFNFIKIPCFLDHLSVKV
jgi:hypothetical protein